jgi:2,5-diketo-D-gluconate reductase A
MTFRSSRGVDIPAVGFGTYLISDQEVEAALGDALRAGYRHVDTAEAYQNEEGVGRALREATEALGLQRKDVFVTTKLWPGNPDWGQPSKDSDAVKAALHGSLQRLGLDFVDLYLIHAPFAGPGRLEQWRALVELRDEGKTRAIGVSNFGIDHLQEIERAGLPLPEADQIELHPWSQKPELVGYLEERGILPIAYSSLVPLAGWRAVEGQDSAKTEAMRAEGASEDSPFKTMAARYGVSEAQVLLRWALQRGFAVLPKSTNPQRVRTNLDLFSFEIDESDMGAIAEMDRGDGVAWAVGDPISAE